MLTLNGVIVPVATPVGVSGSPDIPALRRLVCFLLEHPIQALFANGSMGGFAHFTDADQLAVIEAVAAEADGRVPVFAGVSDTSAARVRERIVSVQDKPVDALVLLPPYYYLCRQDELVRFFSLMADFARKPLVLYDNPRYTQNGLEAATIAALARHANIRGIKISSPDVMKWKQILTSALPGPDEFALICGAEKVMDVALSMGFHGITGGLHNFVPGLAVSLYEAAVSGDYRTARALQAKLNRIYEIFEVDGGWRGLGVALGSLGIASRFAVPPYDLELPQDKRARIDHILAVEGICSAKGRPA